MSSNNSWKPSLEQQFRAYLGETTVWAGGKLEADDDEADDDCYHLLNAHHLPDSVFV